jgi:hypothetical protein
MSDQTVDAFPKLVSSFDDPRSDTTMYESTGGMTLRDYFAAKALPEIMRQEQFSEDWQIRAVAGWAYMIADQMLKAREV